MLVARAPLRISLAGGGSDLPSFYRNDFGQVFSFAINKHVYIACHELFSGGIRLSYSKTENIKSIMDIEHPLIRESMKALKFNESIELGSFADIPGTGTGLGSSSAFTVALVAVLSEFKKLKIDSKLLATTASHIEIDMCLEPIGKQDQFASAYGGINHFIFHANEDVSVNKYYDPETANFLEQSIALYYLGAGRSASDILSSQNKSMIEGRIEHDSVKKIRDRVPDIINSVISQDISMMAKLINESWDDKKKLQTKISNFEIENSIKMAFEAGAIAAKVIGAGGGGFLMLVVDPDKRKDFLGKFLSLRNLPFEISKNGASIVYSDERIV